jgi:tetraacyldisaccharide 4'-kinase
MKIVKNKPLFWSIKNWKAYSIMPLSVFYLFFHYLNWLIKRCIQKKVYNNSVKICVGNLVVGGAGKTPICIELGEYLKKNCKKNPCFISKGYNRTANADIAIPFYYGQVFDYRVVGDEPILLSSTADTFVLKKRNTNTFEKTFNESQYSHIIFDDGLQDGSMDYDIKIAVFDCNFFIGNGLPLPAGPMRDLLSLKLKKIDHIILTDYHDKHLHHITMLEKYVNKSKIHKAKLVICGEYDKSVKYVAFAGIGHNQKFFNTLDDNGFEVIQTISFEDHVNYNKNVIDDIVKYADENNAKIITTMKDFIKIPIDYHSKISYLEIKYNISGINEILGL